MSEESVSEYMCRSTFLKTWPCNMRAQFSHPPHVFYEWGECARVLCVSGGHPEIRDQIASLYLWPKNMHAPMHRPACPQLMRIAAASPKQNLRVCNPMANATLELRQPVSSWPVKLLWSDCVIRTYVWPAPGLENKGTLGLRHPSTPWPLKAGVNAWRVWNLCLAWLCAVPSWATRVHVPWCAWACLCLWQRAHMLPKYKPFFCFCLAP